MLLNTRKIVKGSWLPDFQYQQCRSHWWYPQEQEQSQHLRDKSHTLLLKRQLLLQKINCLGHHFPIISCSPDQNTKPKWGTSFTSKEVWCYIYDTAEGDILNLQRTGSRLSWYSLHVKLQKNLKESIIVELWTNQKGCT